MPNWNAEIRRRLADLHLAPTRENAIIEELSQDLDDVYAELLAGGTTEAQACRQTLAELHDHEFLTRELQRVEPYTEPVIPGTNRKDNMIADLWQDLRFGARMLRKQPGFTLIAILTLALGIGANTAVFSLVDAMLLRSLPVRDPAALVQFKWAAGDSFRGFSYNGEANREDLPGLRVATSFAPATYELLRTQNQTLSGVLAYTPIDQLNVNVGGQAEIASGQAVTGNYHQSLGVPPLLGRVLTMEDANADAPAVAVLSYRFWQRRFGGKAKAVGQQINVNNKPVTIVGITPPAFMGTQNDGQAPDVTIVLDGAQLRQPAFWWLRVLGRLKPGVTPAQAQAELTGIFAQSALNERRQSIPVTQNDLPRLLVAPGQRGETDWTRDHNQSLYLLMTVVALVLLIACANVANLLLARAVGRRKEIAVRLALGAGRFRLMRQFLTESLLLALLGGVFGIVLAHWGRDLLLTLRFPGREMSALATTLDWRVLAFTMSLSLLTGIVFGLVPAWQATRLDLTPALKDTGRSSSAASRSRLSRALVVAQVALSLLLLTGAGLFVRTLRNLQQVNTGFEAQNLLLFRVDPRLSGHQSEQIPPLYQRLFARLEAVPGVQAVSFSRHPLLAGSSGSRGAFFAGQNTSPTDPPDVYIHIARANFLATMNTPLLQGRSLSEQDNAQAPKVAVINQALARQFFPNQNPLGQRFGFDPSQTNQIEIVGVAQDAKYDSLREATPPTIYLSWLQEARIGQMNFEVRTVGDPLSLLPAIRQAVRDVDGNLPLFDVKSQVEQIAQRLAQERLFAALLSFFGALALLLAALGLYGLLAHAVAERTHELGIRMALGAQARDVIRLVIGQGLRLVLPGIVLGLVGAYAATRLVKTFLYGVAPADWLTFSGTALLLLLVALVACWLPARRATNVDPWQALRSE
jgi:predicted permease